MGCLMTEVDQSSERGEDFNGWYDRLGQSQTSFVS
jgi:hypothetical protein